MIQPPDHLTPAAREHWQRLAPELSAAGRLTEATAGILAALCTAYARWADAEMQIAEKGVIVKSPNGYPVQNPFLSVANKAIAQIRQLSSELGMTPKSAKAAGKSPPTDRGADSAERTEELRAKVRAKLRCITHDEAAG